MLATYVRMTTLLDRLRSDERGVTAVEYAVIAGAIAAGLVTAFSTFYTDLGTYLGKVAL